MLFDFIQPEIFLQRLQEIRDKIDNAGIKAEVQSINAKLPSATALSDALSNPTTTIIGSALLGFDGSAWRRLRADESGRILVWLG